MSIRACPRPAPGMRTRIPPATSAGFHGAETRSLVVTPQFGPCRHPGCCDNHKAPVQALKAAAWSTRQTRKRIDQPARIHGNRRPNRLTRRQIAQGAGMPGAGALSANPCGKRRPLLPSGAAGARQHARDVTPSPDPDREAAGIFSEAPLAHPMRIRHRPCGGFLTLSGFGDATGSCQMTAGSCTIHPTTR